MTRAPLLLCCLAAPLGVSACQSAQFNGSTPPPEPSPIRFELVQEAAGIDFRLGHGGRSPLTILETAGGGCAFLDFDGDEWPDVLLVGPRNLALYRNQRDGTFRDVTAASGLDRGRYWMGCAAGDYDGDGRPDLFLTGYRCHALYRNLGGGRFQETTRSAGLESDLLWSMSAAFADLDGDGDLDLFVSQYLQFDSRTPQVCQLGSILSACGPEVYEPISGRLFRNQGDGRFEPWPGGWKDTGKTWGVVVSRLTDGPEPALYLANDMLPGDLWRFRNGRARNIGPASGTAYDAEGHLQGGMGVDSGDYDNDGRIDLLVTTFFAQATSLYRNDGNDLFTVTSGPAGIGAPTMPYVGFGTVFADFDNDGWLDVIIANGHVRDNIQSFDGAQSYAQPLQLFRNVGGRFVDLSATAFGASPPVLVGRGLAAADYNRDGRLDVVVVDLEGRALLLENRSPAGHWLNVRLEGPAGNSLGVGALVTLEAAGGRQVREIKTCGSVLSALDPVAHFGLGVAEAPVRVTVQWPDGGVTRATVPRIDTAVTLRRSGAVRFASTPRVAVQRSSEPMIFPSRCSTSILPVAPAAFSRRSVAGVRVNSPGSFPKT